MNLMTRHDLKIRVIKADQGHGQWGNHLKSDVLKIFSPRMYS